MEETEITIKDESMTGTIRNQFVMKVQNENVKVKDLIKSRVFHEVNLYNRSKLDFFQCSPNEFNNLKVKFNKEFHIAFKIDSFIHSFIRKEFLVYFYQLI